MRGKKFDAHEKHFKEKEIKLNKEIKEIRKGWSDTTDQKIKLINENENLKKENLELLQKYEEAIKLSKLTDEEIQESIKSYKSMNDLSTMFKMFQL